MSDPRSVFGEPWTQDLSSIWTVVRCSLLRPVLSWALSQNFAVVAVLRIVGCSALGIVGSSPTSCLVQDFNW